MNEEFLSDDFSSSFDDPANVSLWIEGIEEQYLHENGLRAEYHISTRKWPSKTFRFVVDRSDTSSQRPRKVHLEEHAAQDQLISVDETSLDSDILDDEIWFHEEAGSSELPETMQTSQDKTISSVPQHEHGKSHPLMFPIMSQARADRAMGAEARHETAEDEGVSELQSTCERLKLALMKSTMLGASNDENDENTNDALTDRPGFMLRRPMHVVACADSSFLFEINPSGSQKLHSVSHLPYQSSRQRLLPPTIPTTSYCDLTNESQFDMQVDLEPGGLVAAEEDESLCSNISSDDVSPKRIAEDEESLDSGIFDDDGLCYGETNLPHKPKLEEIDRALNRLKVAMFKSITSQKAIQEWDRKNGLPASHSKTMVDSSRSREQVVSGTVLQKWNGVPLLMLPGATVKTSRRRSGAIEKESTELD